jgi:hypothetical protein
MVKLLMRFSPRSSYIVLIGFTVLLLITFLTLDHIAPAGRRLAKIAGFDPVNYFDIAHSLLFDHDFNLNNEFTRIKPDGPLWSAIQPNTGLPGSVWGVGYSVLEVPFLALGVAADAIAGNPPDGFSKFSILAYCLGNVVMSGLGLMALFALLYRVGESWNIPKDLAAGYSLLVTLVIFFGTNVGYYTFSQLAHASTFLFASMFVGRWWDIRCSNRSGSWFLLGLIGGFLSICRWQDILFLGGPLVFDLMGPELRTDFRAWLRSRALYAAAAGLCWIPQIAEWKIIYGKYLTIPQGDGFFAFPPHFIWEVMMSSRNGWFIWTPLAFVGVLGLLYGATKHAREFVPWIVVLALELIVVGSMPTWHGFDSFSSRYLLSTAPLIAMGLFTLLWEASPAMRKGLIAASLVFCAYTMLFALQFRLSLIPTNSTLTTTELFTDKLRLFQVRQRKTAVATARQFLQGGNFNAAIQTLEGVADLGKDRDVLESLAEAYSAAGKLEQAGDTRRQLKEFLNSRL